MRSMVSGIASLAFGSLVALAPLGASADTQTQGIDWQKRAIVVSGQAAPDQNAPNIAAARLGAERAARADAMRNIVETLKGVQVTGAKTAADALSDPGVSAKVSGIIRNFKVVDTRYYSDGGVEIDVEMPLDGLVGTLLGDEAPKAKKAASASVAKEGSAAADHAASGNKAQPASAKGAASKAAGADGSKGSASKGSGLVVDVRDIDFVPAMAPRILDEDGNELYGPSSVDPEKLRKGLAVYVDSPEKAAADKRIDSGVSVKAIALSGTRSDVVLSKADAAKVKGLSLESGNVVFVTR